MTEYQQKRLVNKKTAFLRAFIASANLSVAAAAVGMDRSRHYQWLEEDPDYAKQFRQARIEAGQTLEDSAVERALKGVYEPIVYQGQFQFAHRDVKLYTLADGREVREDELPADKSAFEIREELTRTISEPYGPPLGIYRRSEGLHARLLKAFIPERYSDRVEERKDASAGSGGAGGEFVVKFVAPNDAKSL